MAAVRVRLASRLGLRPRGRPARSSRRGGSVPACEGTVELHAQHSETIGRRGSRAYFSCYPARVTRLHRDQRIACDIRITVDSVGFGLRSQWGKSSLLDAGKIDR